MMMPCGIQKDISDSIRVCEHLGIKNYTINIEGTVNATLKQMEDAGIEISNRTLGFVNAPSLMQKAVAMCLEEPTDVTYYDRNRKLLYESLTKLGFTCVKPEGAFYLWMKSPVENEEAFVAAGKKYNLLMVKGSAFGCGGYVRLAYCVSYEMIERSLPLFEKLAKEYLG